MTKTFKKQLYPAAYAEELALIASGDLDPAVGLAKAAAGRPENIVFLAQQSVEKHIKAVLVHLRIAFPAVHDIGILVALLPDDKMPPGDFALSELNSFASVRRYHEADIPLTKEDIDISLDVAHQVMRWAKTSLG